MKPNVGPRRRGDAMKDEHTRILARLTTGGLHPDRVISKPEWAALLGVDIRTAERLLKDGKGPPRILLSPGRIGFLFRDVQDWLVSRREAVS